VVGGGIGQEVSSFIILDSNIAGHSEKFDIKVCMVKGGKNVFGALNKRRLVRDEGIRFQG